METPEEISKYICLVTEAKRIGLSAGASTPDEDVEELYQKLIKLNQKV